MFHELMRLGPRSRKMTHGTGSPSKVETDLYSGQWGAGIKLYSQEPGPQDCQEAETVFETLLQLSSLGSGINIVTQQSKKKGHHKLSKGRVNQMGKV